MSTDPDYCPFRTDVRQCKKEFCGTWNEKENRCRLRPSFGTGLPEG